MKYSNKISFSSMAVMFISLCSLNGCFFTSMATEIDREVKEPLTAKAPGFVAPDNKIMFCVFPSRSKGLLIDSAVAVVDLNVIKKTNSQYISTGGLPINRVRLELTSSDLRDPCTSLAAGSALMKKIVYWKYLSKSDLTPSQLIIEKEPVVYYLPDGRLIYSNQSHVNREYYDITLIKKSSRNIWYISKVSEFVLLDIITFPIQAVIFIFNPDARRYW